MKCPMCDGTGTSNTCVNGTFKPCSFCDGTGEFDPNEVDRFNAVDVIKVMEMVKKPLTNFQRITASPESLAEFINKAEETYERCCKGDIRCDFCECQWCGIAGRSELVEWLKQESE